MSSTFVQTTLDYLRAFKRFSGFDVEYVHVTHGASLGFELDCYDVVFHSYCSRLCFAGYVSESYRDRLRNFSGVKVLAVQDEYDHTDILKEAIKDLKFDIVLTCVPQDSLEYVYPKREFPDVRFITVFTGYVSEDFAFALPPVKPLAERPIFIGYRGRDIGGRYGRLGFDKFEIGRRMKEFCDARGIATDIAMDEASRIYGTDWFDFVGNCRAMLGSESGSNVFDFDGSIDARFKAMTVANGGLSPSYGEFLPIVADRDGEIDMGQVSPRVFECAMMRTPMVLFKGRYSDVIVPDEHYIGLEKDFSNVDEVLAQLGDLPKLEAMTLRAFDHLVAAGQFTYEAFYRVITAAIESKLEQKLRTRVEVSQHIMVDAFDNDGRVLEQPTRSPLGADAFSVRQRGLQSAMAYRHEFDRLREEFNRLMEIFINEVSRLNDVYEINIDSKKINIQSISQENMNSKTNNEWLDEIIGPYENFLLEIQVERDAAFAALRAALFGEAITSAENVHDRVVNVEKDGYFRIIDWLKHLNEAYDAERIRLELTFRSRLEGRPKTAPSKRRSGYEYLVQSATWAKRLIRRVFMRPN